MAKTRRKITLMAPFENVSAKFALVRDRAGVNNGGIKYFGARNIGIIGQGLVNNFYLRKYGRSTQPTTDELKRREYFAAGAKWAKDAMADLTAIIWNQQQFLACKNNRGYYHCGGYGYSDQTIAGFIRGYAMFTLNAGETLPENHKLPEATNVRP